MSKESESFKSLKAEVESVFGLVDDCQVIPLSLFLNRFPQFITFLKKSGIANPFEALVKFIEVLEEEKNINLFLLKKVRTEHNQFLESFLAGVFLCIALKETKPKPANKYKPH